MIILKRSIPKNFECEYRCIDLLCMLYVYLDVQVFTYLLCNTYYVTDRQTDRRYGKRAAFFHERRRLVFSLILTLLTLTMSRSSQTRQCATQEIHNQPNFWILFRNSTFYDTVHTLTFLLNEQVLLREQGGLFFCKNS